MEKFEFKSDSIENSKIIEPSTNDLSVENTEISNYALDGQLTKIQENLTTITKIQEEITQLDKDWSVLSENLFELYSSDDSESVQTKIEANKIKNSILLIKNQIDEKKKKIELENNKNKNLINNN